MKCHGCLKLIKDLNNIKCSSLTCSKSFCSLCINLTELSIEKRSKWKCPDCCANKRKIGDNSSTPVRSNEDDSNVTLRKKADTQTITGMNSEVKELIAEFRLLTQELSSLKKQLEDTTASMTSCQKRLEELGSAIANNDSRIKKLEDRERETELLKGTVKELQQELNIKSQNNISNELELCGIPEINNESLQHVVLLAARKVGVDLEDGDIDWVIRAGPRVKRVITMENNSQFPRPVVVRLLRKTKRDQIIKAAKSRRNIKSTDLDIPGTPYKVFYNERLTKYNRELFREARRMAKQHGFSHCWCSQGTIFVRKSEGKPARPVRNFDDLSIVFSKSI
ncbi:unnamed protein product, partial [Brenthis ino]